MTAGADRDSREILRASLSSAPRAADTSPLPLKTSNGGDTHDRS